MQIKAGKFIVIDGTDGSGKTTQLAILKEKLISEGFEVEVADFPQYNSKSAGLVEEYLSGKYGQANEVDSYKASIFYAVDRYDASFKIKQWLKEGKIVISNRYTSASMGHQGCKIDNPLERKVFFNWLYDLEYKIYEIPKPDLSIILHVDSAIAQKLVKERSREDWKGKTKDIHEENLNHLEKAEKVYLEIARSFPDFRLINCTRNNEILSREEISFLIWPVVKNIVNSTEKSPASFQAIANIIGGNQQIVSHREIIFEHANSKTGDIISIEKGYNSPEIDNSPELIVERLNPQAKLPQKAHTNDAGYDLYSIDYYSINPYGQALVSTGLKMAIPNGYAGLIWDKSGLASEGITTMGGVIDSGYRGEIKVVVKNLSEDIFNIVPGQKVAQIIIQAIPDLKIQEGKIDGDTERKNNGFGSSGKF